MRSKWPELFVSGSIFTWPHLLLLHLLGSRPTNIHTRCLSYVVERERSSQFDFLLWFVYTYRVGRALSYQGSAGAGRGGRSVTLIIAVVKTAGSVHTAVYTPINCVFSNHYGAGSLFSLCRLKTVSCFSRVVILFLFSLISVFG